MMDCFSMSIPIRFLRKNFRIKWTNFVVCNWLSFLADRITWLQVFQNIRFVFWLDIPIFCCARKYNFEISSNGILVRYPCSFIFSCLFRFNFVLKTYNPRGDKGTNFLISIKSNPIECFDVNVKSFDFKIECYGNRMTSLKIYTKVQGKLSLCARFGIGFSNPNQLF